jgi:hypothetical protein
MRIFGASLGVAVSFIVLNSLTQDQLTGVLTPAQLSDFYKSPIAIYGFTPLQQLAVRDVYIDSYNVNMRVCAGIAAVSLVAGLGTYQRNPPSMQQRLDDLQKLYDRSAALANSAALA